MKIVAAIHDPPVWTLPTVQVDRLRATLPDDEVVLARTAEERARQFPDADVLLATRITPDEFQSAKRVRWIQSTAVGVTGLLPPGVVSSPVVVTNTRGVYSQPIAEHAIALVLAVRRRLHTAVARQATRTWAQTELELVRLPPLSESRLLVVGLGAVGSQVAALGRGLGMRVTAVRRRADQPAPDTVDVVVGPERLREALAEADAVVLAAPGTRENRAMLGPAELAVMRPWAVLVNVARGRLVDDDALVAALERGQLAGAGLDAFTREPLPDGHPFWRLPNVLLTPHTASFGGDYWEAAIDFFLDNLARFKRGDALRNVVDKALGY